MADLTLRPWNRSGEVYTSTSSGFVFFKAQNEPGAYSFSVYLREKKISWIAGYRDDKNYVLFELDDKNFACRVFQNGRSRKVTSSEHGLKNLDWVDVRIVVQRNGVTHEMRANKAQIPTIHVPLMEAPAGAFGFLIRPNEPVSMSGLRFEPASDARL